MLNIAAPEKFVLTLQSIPPFLIESILAFALAVFLAVPLIAHLQFLFDNRNSCAKTSDAINTPGKHLLNRHRHMKIQYPSSIVTTSQSSRNIQSNSTRLNNSFYDLKETSKSFTAVPSINPLLDKSKTQTKVKKREDDEILSDDNSKFFTEIYEYELYRDKFIKENIRKQYGHFRPPGNFVLNSLHLSTVDSNKSIKYSNKRNHEFVNFHRPHNISDEVNDNRKLPGVDPRDYFLTRVENNSLETANRGTETVHLSTEVDKLPEIIDVMDCNNTFTGYSNKPCTRRVKREKLSNSNTVKINSRPNTPKRITEKISKRHESPQPPTTPKKSRDVGVISESNNLLLANMPRDEPLDVAESQPQEHLTESKDSSYTVEIPMASGTNEKTEKSSYHVSSGFGKCSSIASNEIVSICSSKNPERRSMNTRPGSSGSGCTSKPFRNLTSKVNSRPRSSGATFDWDVPNIPDKVSLYEKRFETKITTSNAKRPRSANIAINRKKSEALSVLESIMDLSCEVAIDFQESTIPEDIKTFREMSDDNKLKTNAAKNINRQMQEHSRATSLNNKKTKLPVYSSNQKQIKQNTKSIIDTDHKKEYLRSRSGNYNNIKATGRNRKKSYDQ